MHIRTRRHTIAAVLATAGLVAGSGIAAAQVGPAAVPPTNDDERHIAVGVDGIATVTVDEAGADADEVSGSITNESDATLNCEEVTVTEASIVDRSLAYMEDNLIAPPLGLPIDAGSLDVMLGTGSLGSLGLGDPAAIEANAIQEAQNDARQAGHYGAAGPISVDAGQTEDWTVALTVPNGGERTDFDAAALLVCTQDDQDYAFAGYEEDDDNGNGGGGSLPGGSLDMGSLPGGSLDS